MTSGHVSVYLCGILLDECPPSTSVSATSAGGGCLLAGSSPTALVAIGGGALELWWFGASDAAAAQRAERDVHRGSTRWSGAITQVVGSGSAANPAAVGRPERRHRQRAAAVRSGPRSAPDQCEPPTEIAVTIYDQAIVARAWAGAPSDMPNERISAPSTLFVTPSPLGLRLVHVQPIVNAEGGAARRGGGRARPLPGAGRDDAHADRLHARNRSGARRRCGRGSKAPAICRDRARSCCARLGRAARRGVGRSGRARARRVRAGAARLSRAMHRRGRRHGAAAHRAAARPAASAATERAYVTCHARRACALACGGGLLLWTAFAVAARGSSATPVTTAHCRGRPPRPWSASWPARPSRLRVARRGRRACRERRRPSGWSTQLAGRHRRSRCWSSCSIAGSDAVIDPASVDLRHFSLHPWSAVAHRAARRRSSRCSSRCCGRATLALLAAATHWRVPRGASAAARRCCWCCG